MLLEYLREQSEASPKDDSQGPAGRIQVIATTHSPNLASSVGIENVVALRTKVETEQAKDDEGNDRNVDRRKTQALPLAQLNLAPDERRKINQYLDATRAGLLFARRVILVEGIAEAVLLPVIARRCVFGDDKNVDHVKQRRAFHGVTIVNVGSVDFAPYISLLLSSVNDCRLLDRLTVVTDRDPDPELPKKKKKEDGQGPGDQPTAKEDEESDERASNRTKVSNRKEQLVKHAESIGAAEYLIVAEAPHTLEADLLGPTVNESVLKDAYLEQHPQSEHHWKDILEHHKGRSFGFYQKLCKYDKFMSKGEFAHDVALAIEDGKEFEAPEYQAEAIRGVLASGTDG